MEDLRSEIRAAFEREQMQHPPVANLRYAVARSVAARPRPQLNLQWLAVAAAVVIGTMVVVGLISSRHAIEPPPVPSHKQFDPNKDYGPPPAGVKLIYIAVPGHDGWFDGFDWSGEPRGTVKMSPPPTGVLMAPDGQSFAFGVNAKGGSWQFLDGEGQPTGAASLPGAYSPVWADDNRHVCSMTFDASSLVYTLWTTLPGESPKHVVDVAHDTSVGQTTISLAACSFRNDRAIAVRTSVAWPSELWVIRLSDGQILAHHTYGPSEISSVVASSDAKYVAESSWYANGVVPASGARTAPPGTQTWIRRVDDWVVLAHMDPSYAVVTFSGDGTRVLVRTQLTPEGTASRLAVLKWSEDGNLTVIWTYEGKEQLLAVAAEAGGDGLAIGFVDPADTTTQWCAPGAPACEHLQTIVIVRGDGPAVQLPGRYNPTW